MVLEHVANGAGALIVAGPMPDALGFGHGDLDMVDVAAVPDGLKDGVGKAKDHQVLDGLFAEVVIDSVDIGFVKGGMQGLVQLAGALQVVPEWLLDDDPLPTGRCRLQPRLGQLLNDAGIDLRRQCQVEQAVGGHTLLALETLQLSPQPGIGVRVAIFTLNVGKARLKAVPK